MPKGKSLLVGGPLSEIRWSTGIEENPQGTPTLTQIIWSLLLPSCFCGNGQSKKSVSSSEEERMS